MMNSTTVPNTFVEIAPDPVTLGITAAECNDCLLTSWFDSEAEAIEWAFEHALCNCTGD
jgi:hypothetical protein